MWRSRRPNAVLTTSAAAGRCIGLLVLLACLCPSSFVSSSGMSGGPRVGVTPPRALPAEQKFSNDKLRAETEDPFAKVKVALFGFLTGGAGVGLLFILPRLLATLFGAPRASPLPSVLQDVAVNFGAMVFCGFLTYQEWNQDSVRSQAKEEGALIARLPIQVPMDGEVVEARLSDLRVGRQMKSRRPVLCLGNLQFCRDCISAAMEVQEAMTRCDFLLVPVLYNSSAEDASSLAEAAKDLRFVALPGKDPDGDWAQLSEIQLAQVRSQGLDEAIGQAIIIKKNGRVGTRFLGVPEWKSLTAEVDARVKLGLDTRNV